MDRKDYIEPINISSTKKILEQMINSICKIEVNNEKIGTGYFCKVNSMNFLMTSYYIIDEKYLKENKEINILINNNENIKIDIEIQREIYFNKEYGITIIELKDEDKIKNYYLELDDNLYKDNEYYKYKSIYILQYLNDKEIYVSYGYINEINNKNEIKYICYTDNSSIGSPILNLKNNKIIGIVNNNYGILLKYPLIDFKRKGYKIIKELGHGGFGKVNKVLNILDNKYYAIKEILLQNESEITINNIKKESNILSKFDCNNIVKYYDSYQDKDKYYIIMEYCDDKNLKDYIEEYKNNNNLIEENIIYKKYMK